MCRNIRTLANFARPATMTALNPNYHWGYLWCAANAAAAGSLDVPRFFVGVPSLFYGVEHLLHPEYVPGIPLKKLTPGWIPGRIGVSYVVGVILIGAGVCLLLNRKTRIAAAALRITIALTVLWVYLPMLLRAPTDIVALNYFFDTLLFGGAILLLAASMEQKTATARP